MKKNLAILTLALLSTSAFANLNPIKTHDGALRTCNSKSDVTKPGKFLYKITDVNTNLDKSGYSKVSFSLSTLRCEKLQDGSYSFIPYSVPSVETQVDYTGENYEVKNSNFKLVISNENSKMLKEIELSKLDGQKQYIDFTVEIQDVDSNTYNVNQVYNMYINVNFAYTEDVKATDIEFTNQRMLGTYKVFFN